MYSLPSPALLQRTRAYGTRFFHRFGIHCATHQIRLILVSSIVITSLLFPAIAVYTSPETHFFAGFTLRVLDSFLTPDDISSYFAQHDLRHIWEGHNTLRLHDDSVARAQCGMQSILRSERLLIGSVSQEYGLDALDRDTLLSALALEHRISTILSQHHIPCLKSSTGSCFSLSPLAFWNHDEAVLSADASILETINLSHNTTTSGIPMTPEMVFAGREHDPSLSSVDSAMFLALTYFFPDRDCLGNNGHVQWLRVLREAGGPMGDLVVQAQPPRLVALEYDRSPTTKTRFTILSAFCYGAYLVFVVYCVQSMRNMKTVHSRFGLAVTGLVELIVRFRMTMVPWELFPIIVMFIGVENMFHIVDAVLRTSVTIPVKERIAQGLSQAGTSNTLKVVSYNAVLGVIAFFSSGAIRQFCAFSIVVLVAHWFLVHTFFVTVLSIDIQRLELDELLRQDTNLNPTDKGKLASPTLPPPKTWREAWLAAKNTIRGRPGKNISLFLLLAIAATLYFATTPSSTQAKSSAALARNPVRQVPKMTATDRISPAYRIWQTLNPIDDTMVHIRIESPAILVLAPEEDKPASDVRTLADGEKLSRPRVNRLSRWWMRTVRDVWWLFKIMVVPITATTVLLYALLLYLLKNAELLEAQRQRPEPDNSSSEESSVEGEISFATLPRAFPTDVDMLATSKNGKVVVMLGLQNEVVVWRSMSRTNITVDTSPVALGGASGPSQGTTLTAVAVNEAGTLCAVGSASGVIGVWSIERDHAKYITQLSLDPTSTAAVAHLHFGYFQSRPPSPARPLTPTPPVDVATTPRARYVAPTRSATVIKSTLVPVHGDERLLVGFAFDDGSFELCDLDRNDQLVARECWIAAGNPQDFVNKVDVCALELDGQRHIIIIAATQAGVVSLWDAGSRDCLFIMEEPFGDVNQLRVTPVTPTNCSTCGELPCENFLITFSVGLVVLFYRAYLYLPTRRCSCPRNQPQPALRTSMLGHRSRSGSATSLASSTGTTTPVASRSRVPSVSSSSSALSASMFPVSAHGVHSRRASEKEGSRRTHDSFLSIPTATSLTRILRLPLFPSPTSVWQSLIVVRVADTMFERGSWDVAGDKVVGVRRKPRSSLLARRMDAKATLKDEPLQGLSSSTLERWELWTYDPEESRLHVSPLNALRRGPEERLMDRRRSGSSHAGLNQDPPVSPKRVFVPRLHFTRVTPFIATSTCCLAGFGNTVGLFNVNSRPNARRRRRSSGEDIQSTPS
ncbi:sterol regulatory element binding protein cleavage-activating protein [Fomitopsis serialis]|uniref:sterol regulatory element binding protein cleavage-activating protein n=1 Tax=Fomitopsis serialis TaxID=139415 RepID=UPI0020086967|nr:sterol regulatory element binding protein cleavage-activating protein [Neoantrodia serialis]KAH9934975.1 sterol regulatory element binding protein cleavage-activating protein [Neoantrodia serialis]